METVFRTEQVFVLSKKLKLSQKSVKTVLDSYINRITSRLENGETVKFLNICYLVNEERGFKDYQETTAYISNEIGKETKLGKECVFRILTEFERLIVKDVKNFYTYTITGLLKISCCEYKTGVYKVRIRKSDKYDSQGIRVATINSFKRKVELDDRKDT